MRIGELSRRSGCRIETIRYYERIGLLPPPLRTASRYRVYEESDVRRLAFLRRARQLGFTLGDVRALLRLAGKDDGETCGEAQRIAGFHLAQVRGKIADLAAIAEALAAAVRRCEAGKDPACPLLEALSVSPLLSPSRRSTSGTPAR